MPVGAGFSAVMKEWNFLQSGCEVIKEILVVLMSLSFMPRQNFTRRKCLINKYVLNLFINKKRQEVKRIIIKPQASCFIIIIYNVSNFSLIISRKRKWISRVKSENKVWQIG